LALSVLHSPRPPISLANRFKQVAETRRVLNWPHLS
jgi:hypothetical protein